MKSKIYFSALLAGSLAHAGTLDLESLNLNYFSSGWGTTQAGKSIDGNKLTIGNEQFSKGIGTHAPSLALIQLDGKATRFTAQVGVDREVGDKGSVVFQVIGDGKILFESQRMTGKDAPQAVDISIENVRDLTLNVTDGGDGNAFDHANWVEASITYEGEKPMIQPILDAGSFGLRPDTHRNVMPALRKLIENLGEKNHPVTVTFAPGRYDFWPEDAFEKEVWISNHADKNPKNIAFLLEKLNDITIDGRGAQFMFHGEMIPFEIIDSENITLKNLSIDWERPLFSQGEVVNIGPDFFDFKFSAESKFRLINNRIFFYGEGWGQFGGTLQGHCGDTGRIIYRTADGAGIHGNTLGNKPAELIGERTVRIQYKLPDYYKNGDVILSRHLDRDNPGIHIYRAKDTVLDNVSIHHCGGMGIIGQRSENITITKLNIAAPEGSGRRITTYADGTHFSGCKGLISVEDSYFEYMFDDAINIHGTYVRIQEKTGPKTLRARFMHDQAKAMDNAGPGDQVMLIDNETMLPYTTLTVKSFKNIGLWEAEYVFEEEIPERMKFKDGIENITWTPRVIFRNNKVVHNRARGMLFNGAGEMIVENNYVQTSGSAILVAGDCNYWFESGPVGIHGPLIIRNNVFDTCLTNAYQFTHAQISIDPVIPKTVLGGETYHKDIFIENNVFKVFDAPILFARSVKGLHFKNNTIEQVDTFKPWHYNPHMFKLEACKDVHIANTKLIGEPIAKDIKLIKTDRKEIKEDMGLEFK